MPNAFDFQIANESAGHNNCHSISIPMALNENIPKRLLFVDRRYVWIYVQGNTYGKQFTIS